MTQINGVEIVKNPNVILAVNNAVSNIMRHDGEFDDIDCFYYPKGEHIDQPYFCAVARFKPRHLRAFGTAITRMQESIKEELGVQIKNYSIYYSQRRMVVDIRFYYQRE